MHDWNFDGEITSGDMAVDHLIHTNLHHKRKPVPARTSRNNNAPKARRKDVEKFCSSYVHRTLFKKAYVESADLRTIEEYLCNNFSNIEIYLEPDENRYPRIRICIKSLLHSSTICYQIRHKGILHKT